MELFELLPLFRSIENNQEITNQFHGNFGDVWVDSITILYQFQSILLKQLKKQALKKQMTLMEQIKKE